MGEISKESIQETLFEVIANEMEIDVSEIKAEMSLKDDLDLASLDAMNVIMELEERYAQETEIEDILEMKYLHEIIDYLHQMLNSSTC